MPPAGEPDAATDPQTTSSDDSGETLPDPTTGTGPDGGETTDAPDATTGGPAVVEPCGVDDPQLFSPQPYTASETAIDAFVDDFCLLTSFGPADAGPAVQVIDFECEDAWSFRLEILDGPLADWTPYVGQWLRVGIQHLDGTATGRAQEMVSVGLNDQLIYSSARMDQVLMPILHGPLYPSAAAGTCAYAPTADDPGAPDDAFWCAEARRDRLSVFFSEVGDNVEVALESGQATTVPVPKLGGSYEIEARTIAVGRGCVGLPADEEVYTVAYAVAFHAD